MLKVPGHLQKYPFRIGLLKNVVEGAPESKPFLSFTQCFRPMVLNEFCPEFPQEWAILYEQSKNHFLITLDLPCVTAADKQASPGTGSRI